MHCISYQASKSLIKKKKKKKENLFVNASTHTTHSIPSNEPDRKPSRILENSPNPYPSHVPFSPVFTSFLPLSIPSKPIHSLIQSTTASLWHLSTRESKHKIPNANETESKKKKKKKKKTQKIQNISYYSYKRKINKKSGTLLSPDI